MSELYHECGIAALYHLPGPETSSLVPGGLQKNTTRLITRMLLDIQNRGQLAAGMTCYNAHGQQLIDTHKDVGTVNEVFHLNHEEQFKKLMADYPGTAAIGHTRYATCGQDDRSYAQPFERHHIEKPKWFSFAFNGQLANYPELKDEILSQTNHHLTRETDTEILMHLICQELSASDDYDLFEMIRKVSARLDGAYNIAYLNSLGEMLLARDPLGIRPLCYASDGLLFAAASESVALTNLGYPSESIRNLEPGHAIVVKDGEIEIKQFAESSGKAHCFFEWIYFANVCSNLDERSVYLTRKRLGEQLARLETVEIDEDTIVVPVPDTAKGAADSMAYQLKIPSLEGLIRNRYIGRTFIEGNQSRGDKVRAKYTPLPEVLEGKKVLLVEDTIVRSTTMKALISQLRDRGKAKEIHVRVACPPIVAPCFYGIDMSTVSELFAPRYLGESLQMTPEIEQQMASDIGADSLRYLPISSVAESIDLPEDSLCRACVNHEYPTEAGRKLYQIALNRNSDPQTDSDGHERTYDSQVEVSTRT